jgi:transposase
MIDGTIVSVHQKAIGKSKGGLTTKIVALLDALENLARFVLLPGQRHDSIAVAPLIEDIEFAALLADKAFDVGWLRRDLNERGALAVIPPRSNRRTQYEYDTHVYRWRHLVENYFTKIMEFRGIATPYDKTDTSYAANLNLVAAIIAAR